MLLTLKTTR